MNTKIDIPKDYTSEERMTREGGEKLRLQILVAAAKSKKIELLLHHVPIASVSFWDESIAKLLLEGWSEKDIKTKIQMIDTHPRDLEIIRKLIHSRKASS